MSNCSCNGCYNKPIVQPVTKIESYVKVVPASSYVLPVATEETLGGIKIGEGLSISEDGVLSVAGEIVPPADDKEPGTNPPSGGNDDTNGDIATDEEVDDTLDDIFGENDSPENNDPSEEENGDVATDEEVDDMLDDIFGI